MIKKVMILFALIALQYTVYAQKTVILPLNGKLSTHKSEEKTLKLDPKSSSRTIYNVTVPSIEIYQPEGMRSNGAGVLVVPGGAFHILAYDDEGVKIAQALTARGYTAGVLKYRLVHMDGNNLMEQLMEKAKDFATLEKIMAPVVPLAVADGKEAMKYLKANAASLGFSEDRIGVIGFSAGGTIAAAIAHDKNIHPLFSAPIYPYLSPVINASVPANPSPLFIAVAENDDFGFDINSLKLYEKWKSGKGLAELHIYAKGRHGFASKKQGLPVDDWMKRFTDWLDAMGFAAAK